MRLEQEARGIPPKYFLTFQGVETHPVRRSLGRLHNGRDVVIVNRCTNPKALSRRYNECTLFGETPWEFEDLLANTTFSLVVGGHSIFSPRLLEVLAAGAIPVIVADEWVLPYSDVIDWEAVAVQVPYRRWNETVEILRGIGEEKRRGYKEMGRVVYERHFITFAAHFDSLLQVLQARLDRLHKVTDRPTVC